MSLPSSPKKVFHPDEPFRWEVVDCMQGYACLRTRFLEDGVGVGGNKIQDPKSFFLGIFDVGGFSDGMKIGDYYAKVFFDTNDPEIKGAHLKWKIICTANHAVEFSKIDYDECNFYNQDQMRPQLELYHDWNDGVLGKATFRMRKSTNTWNFLLMLPQFKEARKQTIKIFQNGLSKKLNILFKIKMIIFVDNYSFSFYVFHCFDGFLSETGTVAFEVCNHSNAMVVENFDFTRGISVGRVGRVA